MEISYSKLAEKFIDKWYFIEFFYLIPMPQPFISGRLAYKTADEELEFHKKAILEVYGKEWDEWEQWIDHQNYK